MTSANPQIFRTYDIRGIAETDLPDEVVRALGGALAERLGPEGTVAVGGDVRLSTPRVKAALIAGLTGRGTSVLDVGIGPTPLVYYAAHRHADRLIGAIAVTASHNPPEYNGFKMLAGTRALFGGEIESLRTDMTSLGSTGRATGAVEALDLREDYLADLAGRIELARPLRIVVDAANGAASLFGPEVYRRLGCEVVELYCEPDGTFPNHEADPTVPEALVDLQAAVARHEADLGIGFDGDGDRIGVVDDRGRIAWGDQLMALYYREILARRPGAPAIIEVKCSQALFEEVERLGGKPFFHATGHSLIKAKMKEVDAPFAGEMSGHMFFADEFPGYDDAIYAGARLLRLVASGDRPLSALVDEVPAYEATPELRVGCPEDVKFDVVAAFVEGARKDYEVITVDGGRVLAGDGWGLVRASNTSPKLIVRTEGRTVAARDRILGDLRARLAVHPSVDLSAIDRFLGAAD